MTAQAYTRCPEVRVHNDGGVRWICMREAGHSDGGHCFWNIEGPVARLAAAEARARRFELAYQSARRRAANLTGGLT